MPLQQHDPLTAPMALVNILAWQREIERLGQEPEELFRIRVAHATALHVMRVRLQVGKICSPSWVIRILDKTSV
ncbi:hypothetical protein JCM19053_4725 [Vibrio sp. JCM 19053]|nr:hypothetical protein JCM19053_4725 [Vibrio sp. JCM 19053]